MKCPRCGQEAPIEDEGDPDVGVPIRFRCGIHDVFYVNWWKKTPGDPNYVFERKPEPGELIAEVDCACCAAHLRITHGDDEGDVAVVGESSVQTPSKAPLKLDAVRRIIFLHGKWNRGSVVYREAVEELARLGLDPG